MRRRLCNQLVRSLSRMPRRRSESSMTAGPSPSAIKRSSVRRATATPEPIPKIGCKNASPPRREFNDGRSFAERDQTLERTASEAGDRGGLIVGVDGERGLPAPCCGVTAFVPGQACRTSRQDAHPPVGTRKYTTVDGTRSCLRDGSYCTEPAQYCTEPARYCPFTSLLSVPTSSWHVSLSTMEAHPYPIAARDI